jgi:hypothetical protein
MPNRTAKFVSAIFVSILAGAPLATISHSETVAADNCLSGPKGETPAGSHWFYRVERSTKRHCWYLRQEDGRLSQAAPQNILPSAKPPSPPPERATQHSVANARAELSAQTNVNDEANTAWPANAAGLNDSPRADTPDANAMSAVVASRWPEPSGVSSAFSQRPAPGRLADNAPTRPMTMSAPAVAAVTDAAADSSSQSQPDSQSQPGSIAKLFVAIIAAVAFFGIMASLILTFSRARRPRRTAVRARRGPVWETTDDDRIVLSDYPDADPLPRRPHFARAVGEASDPDDRMAQFLAKMTGRAPT